METIVSIASLIVSIALAVRLFVGDKRKETAEQSVLMNELKGIKSDTNEIKAEIKGIKEDVKKDHDELVRHDENLKQIWHKIGEMQGK